MDDKDEIARAVRWYFATQMLKAITILGGLAIIAHVIEKLRGG